MLLGLAMGVMDKPVSASPKSEKGASQVPWIEILGYFRASRGTVLDLHVMESSCCDGRHRGRP